MALKAIRVAADRVTSSNLFHEIGFLKEYTVTSTFQVEQENIEPIVSSDSCITNSIFFNNHLAKAGGSMLFIYFYVYERLLGKKDLELSKFLFCHRVLVL